MTRSSLTLLLSLLQVTFVTVNGVYAQDTKEVHIYNKLLARTSKTTAEQPAVSVLSQGDWYALDIYSDGIYKITASDLQSLGINTSKIDPRNIHLVGNGGRMLPQLNSDYREVDLAQNAIYVHGEDDGSFDGDDYILFYGHGPHGMEYTSDSLLTHEFNIYAEHSRYFLSVQDEPGKRITQKVAVSGAVITRNSANQYRWHESDLYNIIGSGREWYGENFDFEDEYTFQFSLKGRIPATDVKVTFNGMAQSELIATFFNIDAGPESAQVSVSSSTAQRYGIKGVAAHKDLVINGADYSADNLSVSISHLNNGNGGARGFINNIGVNYTSEIVLDGNQNKLYFLPHSSEQINEVEVNHNNTNLRIWDVSNPVNAMEVPYELRSGKAYFTDSCHEVKEYVLLEGSSFESPNYLGKIENQNLHGITSSPELLIIYHNDFKAEAERLANFKRDYLGMTVEIAEIGEVYNEFSSGRQDISAIRDFIKMLYERNTVSHTLKNVLLFGDASYDYKDRIQNNSNYIPIYESYQSLHNINSYSSDDYYAFLEDDEGTWKELGGVVHDMEVGIGRLPCNNADEARVMVDKIIHYSSDESTFGDWRNQIAFVADDGDSNRHMQNADELTELLEAKSDLFNVRKIYLDAYPQVSLPGGEEAPECHRAVSAAAESGSLIINYTGHGGEVGWTQEQILSIPQLQSWENMDNLPFFITATCEFGRYDDPERQSGAELLMTSAIGGAIGLVTTTRPVYSSTNQELNEAFDQHVYNSQADSNMYTIGEIHMKSKNDAIIGINNRNFSLLGDPSLTLNYPEKNVVITSVTDDEGSNLDTVGAQQRIRIEGEVRYHNDKIMSDFNGVVFTKIYDKEMERETFGNGTRPFSFNTRSNILYNGRATVTNGKFVVELVLPRDIIYSFGLGKVSLYAYDNEETDAGGAYQELVIGGSAKVSEIDNSPPLLELFMDDYSFVSGGLTNDNTVFLAKLYDENGINTATSGVGHELVVVLDDESPLVVNDYYVTEIDDYTQGYISLPLDGLEEGQHEIALKAWDTYNNSTTERIQFEISDGSFRLAAYPNPVVDRVTFEVDHHLAGEYLELLMEIYTDKGELVTSRNYGYENSSSRIKTLQWDARNDYGAKVLNGVYLARISLYNSNFEKIKTKVSRIIVIDE